MQESRLFGIVYYLMEKGAASARVLAQEFEVSERTIYRDIDALSSRGIPIYTETGRQGGVRLMDEFSLDKVILSESERTVVLEALQSVPFADSEKISKTISKLSALFKLDTVDWIEVDLSRWGSVSEKEKAKFDLIKEGILNRKYTIFAYMSEKGQYTRRVVAPEKLIYRGEAWYLYGFCSDKKDNRLFRLTRIRNLRLTERAIVPRYQGGREEGQWLFGIDVAIGKDTASQRVTDQNIVDQRVESQRIVDRKAADQRVADQNIVDQRVEGQRIVDQKSAGQRVTGENTVCDAKNDKTIGLVDLNLTFDHSVAYRIYDVFEDSAVSHDTQSGIVTVNVTIPQTEWLYHFLMSFGEKLLFVAPVDVRKELIMRYEKAWEHGKRWKADE